MDPKGIIMEDSIVGWVLLVYGIGYAVYMAIAIFWAALTEQNSIDREGAVLQAILVGMAWPIAIPLQLIYMLGNSLRRSRRS